MKGWASFFSCPGSPDTRYLVARGLATGAEALTLAVQYHQAGNLAEAERIYRQVLLAEPANAQALHLLGLLAHQVGRQNLALCHMRQALAQRPHDAFRVSAKP